MNIINHFGLSGGKDSSALWAWALFESGYPIETVRASFCDTENEYEEVYDQIAALDKIGQARGAAPIRILRSEGFLNLCIRKKGFPSAKKRFCTEETKIIPTLKHIEEFWLQGFDVVLHSGVRAVESTERALMEEWGIMHNCKLRRPLLKLSIADVWKMHKTYGIPINPLYFTGRKRVGCMLCCMSNKQDIRIAAKTRPEIIEHYRKMEKTVSESGGSGVGFFHATTVPKHFRSIKGLIRRRDSDNGKKGDKYDACTIDDVVKWSYTLRGGKQIGFDFMYDDEPVFEIDDMHAPCKSGYCE